MDGKGRLWCWSWSTPARRPCLGVPAGWPPSPLGASAAETPYTQPPHTRRGFILALPVFWAPGPTASPSHTRTVRLQKGARGARCQRGQETLTGSEGAPSQPPGEAGARRRLPGRAGSARPQHLDRSRPVRQGASLATRPAGAVRHAPSPGDRTP